MAHMLRAMYANNKSAILVNGKPTKWFDVLQGVRQGGTESPLLFKIFIDGLVEKLREVDGGVDMNADTLLSIVLFADDIVLLASSRVALQKMINVVAQYSHKWRFQENLGKCGVMSVRVGKRGRKCPPLVFFGQDIAEVQEYKYLGVMVSEDLSWTKHIEYTLKKARKAVTKYKTIFTNRKLPIKMRLTVYKIYVRTRMEHMLRRFGSSTPSKQQVSKLFNKKHSRTFCNVTAKPTTSPLKLFSESPPSLSVAVTCW